MRRANTYLTLAVLILASVACSTGSTPKGATSDGGSAAAQTHVVDHTVATLGTLKDVFIVPQASVSGRTVSWAIKIPEEREIELCRGATLHATSKFTLSFEDELTLELPVRESEADFVDEAGRACNRTTLSAGTYQASLSYPGPSAGGAVFVSSAHPRLRKERLESLWLAATGKPYGTEPAQTPAATPSCTTDLSLLVNLTTKYQRPDVPVSTAWASGFFSAGTKVTPIFPTPLSFAVPASPDEPGQYFSVLGCDDGGLSFRFTDESGTLTPTKQHPEYGGALAPAEGLLCTGDGYCGSFSACLSDHQPATQPYTTLYGFTPTHYAGSSGPPPAPLVVYPSWPDLGSILLRLGMSSTADILQAVSSEPLACFCAGKPYLMLASVAAGARDASAECPGIFNELVLADITAAKIVVEDDGCDQCALTNVDFPKANVTHFSTGNFEGTTLRSVNFSGVTFGCGNFASSSFADVRFSNAKFLTGTASEDAATSSTADPCTNFSGVTGDQVSFSDASLPSAVFSAANLSDADFDGADLSSATLASATLMDARFSDAYIANATLTDLVADGGTFDGATLWGATLSGDFPSNATAKLVSFRDVVFLGAHFAGANFEYTDLTGAFFNSVAWDPICLPQFTSQRNCLGAECTCSNQIQSPLTAAGDVTVGDRSICPDGTSQPGGCGPVLSTSADGCAPTTRCQASAETGECGALTYCNAPHWVPGARQGSLANDCVTLTCAGQGPPPP